MYEPEFRQEGRYHGQDHEPVKPIVTREGEIERLISDPNKTSEQKEDELANAVFDR